MPTTRECVCCCDIVEIERKKKLLEISVKCITLHPGFYTVCLDMWVLQAAYYVYRQHYGATAHHGSVHE
jgi:hypothetical protein